MNNNFFREYTLDNDLKLELIDQSKKIVSDRFYLCILTRISIPVELKWFDQVDLNQIKFNEIQNTLGSHVVFERKQEKYFVEESLKEKYINLFVNSIFDLSVKYFSHHKFPSKFILKCFFEKNKMSSYQ